MKKKKEKKRYSETFNETLFFFISLKDLKVKKISGIDELLTDITKEKKSNIHSNLHSRRNALGFKVLQTHTEKINK